MMLFLNNKLVMLATAITLLIIITSNTVLVTSSSESHHFVQHRQGRRLLLSKAVYYRPKNGKMFPTLERDDSLLKTENGLESENGSDDNKYEFSHNRPRLTNTPSIGAGFTNTPLIGRTGSTNTPMGRTGSTTTGKSLNNKDNLSHVQPLSKQKIKDWRNKLLMKAAKEVVREIIDQNSACPVLGYNPYPDAINQYYFKRDNDRNISYVDCYRLNHTDPANSLASSKNYQNPINMEDLNIVRAYASSLLPNTYTSIGQIYLPSTL